MPGQTHRFFQEETVGAGDRLELNETNARIARSVLRLSPGDPMVLLDGRGGVAAARLLNLSRKRAAVEVLEKKEESPPSPEIILLQGLPKGEKSSWIVQKSVELGVAAVLFFESGRTIGRKGAGQDDRWRRVAVEAMRQSGNSRLPRIEGPIPLREALGRLGAGVFGLLLDEAEKSRRLRDILGGGTPPVLCVAVGPEGGWSEEDRAEFRAYGFVSASAGPFVLRTETAALAAVAAVRAWG
jgi:16S rRNA (uracil1498-N3)-methyltransferase